MPIPPFTVIPSRDRPATFSSDGDTHLAELQAFVDGANALEQSLQLVATTGTSTTSASIGTGSKSLTTQTGKAWIAGSWLYIVSSSSITNTMQGQVTAYNSGTGSLTVNVTSVSGAGTFASWAIGLSVVDAKLGNATDTWLVDSAGADRQYFLSGGSTYFKGYGAYPFVLKNGAGLDIFNLTQDGRATLLAQGTNAMDAATVRQTQLGAHSSAVAGGTVNAITASFSPEITSVVAGTVVRVLSSGANTISTPSLSVGATGEGTIVKGNDLPLAVGDIPGAGYWCEFALNQALTKWVLMNPASGIVQLATSAEAIAGTDTAKPITPATLQAGKMVSSSAVATTSGVSVDFTGIPSWARRITLLFNGVSTNGTDNLLVQIGSGSFATSGYASAGDNGVAAFNSSAGFAIQTGAAAYTVSGALHVILLGSNTYVSDHTLGRTDSPLASRGGGSVALAGAMDRLRLTTVGGTDNFDTGSVSILWE